MRMMPRVKICCIGSVAEAEVAIRHGADALGLVSAMPSGPGPISDELVAAIAATVPPPIATFLLTSLTDEETAEALDIPLRTVQRRFADARRWLFERLNPTALCPTKTNATNS